MKILQKSPYRIVVRILEVLFPERETSSVTERQKEHIEINVQKLICAFERLESVIKKRGNC